MWIHIWYHLMVMNVDVGTCSSGPEPTREDYAFVTCSAWLRATVSAPAGRRAVTSSWSPRVRFARVVQDVNGRAKAYQVRQLLDAIEGKEEFK